MTQSWSGSPTARGFAGLPVCHDHELPRADATSSPRRGLFRAPLDRREFAAGRPPSRPRFRREAPSRYSGDGSSMCQVLGEDGFNFQCNLCDSEVVYSMTEILLRGLSIASVDSTTGDIFKSPSSVAVGMKTELAEYLIQRSAQSLNELSGALDIRTLTLITKEQEAKIKKLEENLKVQEAKMKKLENEFRFVLSFEKEACCHSVTAVSGGHKGLWHRELKVTSRMMPPYSSKIGVEAQMP
ncbi:hypothetical protein GUJ93_ZPchr0006g42755 [Zizania palustris]|uniref:Uncharacterized protein n=1 Tax=Zizania palustris TaxID=103762 RepID=A0A8J5STZ1_ZIZPA|nr:hypothetical protein GUJ93_ZPchr0006g42755 [Zizania palustris]